PPFAAGDTGHVHANVSRHDAQPSGGMNKRYGFGAVNHIFARQAGHVRARANAHRAFDSDSFLALARAGPAEKLSGGAAGDDQILNVLGTHDLAPVFVNMGSEPTAARSPSNLRRATRARSRAGPGP